MEPVVNHQVNPDNIDSRLPTVEHGFAFHFAAEYFDRGWSVLPLAGKRPAISSWRKFQAERASLCQLRKWFQGSERNVGVVTGRLSGLVVVDCDTECDAQFWNETLPKTPLAVQTGGGGCHFYYRYPSAEEISNRTGLLKRRIDLRAEGGYVVAPPSRHPNGDPYLWQGTSDYHLEDVPLFSSDWIADKSFAVSAAPTGRILRPSSYILMIHAISGQHGHNQTFRAACKLRDAGLSPEEALCELVIWNQTNASPPWSVQELLHKVQSAYKLRLGHKADLKEASE